MSNYMPGYVFISAYRIKVIISSLEEVVQGENTEKGEWWWALVFHGF